MDAPRGMSLFGDSAGEVRARRPSVGGLVRLMASRLADSLSGRFTHGAVVGRFLPGDSPDLTPDLGARAAGRAAERDNTGYEGHQQKGVSKQRVSRHESLLVPLARSA